MEITQFQEQGQKEKEIVEETTVKEYWLLHFDGASKTKTSEAGLVLQSLEGFIVEYALKLDFPTANNEAEYKALIASLGLAKTLRANNIKICEDSRLVVSQVNDEYEVKEPKLK